MESEFAMKNLTAGQLNAIVKRLGGEDAALQFLRGELMVQSKPVEPPAPRPYLESVTSLSVPACEEFDVEAWVGGLPKYDQGSNFRSLVKGRIEKNVPAGQIRQFRNARGANGVDIVKEITEVHRGKYACFADIKTFIESGAAKKDSTWYVFVLEIDGQKWLVSFDWLVDGYGQGWYLCALRPGDCDFYTDSLFLFRDSN